jgi:hypothetical protein
MKTAQNEPNHAADQPQFLQRDHVRPLIVEPQTDWPITQEKFSRKINQLTPDEHDAYQAIVSAGRIRDCQHLDQFCGTVGRYADREPDVLAVLLEYDLIQHHSLKLAEGYFASFFEPTPVLSDEAERLRIKSNKETAADRENQAAVLTALVEAEAVATSTELRPFLPDGYSITSHAISKALKRLVELGQVEQRSVEITPRKSAKCYVPAAHASSA